MDSILRRALPWLLALGIIVSGLQLWFERPLHWGPGVLAANEPAQTTLQNAAPQPSWLDAAAQLTPRAAISAKVRVLSHQRYRWDRMSRVVPVDLAVGWGKMSDSAVLDQIDISQSARFMTWRTGAEPPVPWSYISNHAANWHIIPADKSIARTLARIRSGDIVVVEGDLVDVDKPGDWYTRTSLTREDTGAGACEVVLVKKLEILWRH